MVPIVSDWSFLVFIEDGLDRHGLPSCKGQIRFRRESGLNDLFWNMSLRNVNMTGVTWQPSSSKLRINVCVDLDHA